MSEIIVDEKIRFGKPVIKGTRLTVDEVLGALAGGMSYEEIEREYKIKKGGHSRSIRVCDKDRFGRARWQLEH